MQRAAISSGTEVVIMTVRNATPSCSPMSALRDAEQCLGSLPPLEDLFLAWQSGGRRRDRPDLSAGSLLVRREQLLGPMTLPAASIQLLYDVAETCLSRLSLPEQESTWATRPLHARISHHAPSLTALQTQAVLPAGVLVQKTVSVLLDDTCLLWTGVGPFRLTRTHVRTVARSLGLTSNATSHATINPASVDPVEQYGMQPGMVSSFLPPYRQTGLAALVLLPSLSACPRDAEQIPEQEWEIAISLSLWESLLLPLCTFRPLIEAYSKRACPALRVIALESEKPTDEPDVTHSSNDATAAATVRSRTAVA